MTDHTTTKSAPGRRMPLTVWVGAASPASVDGHRVVHVNPTEVTPVGAVDAVRVSGLTTADLRGLTFVAFSPDCDPVVGLAVYVSLCVLAGRRLDAVVDDTIVSLASLHKTLVSLPALARIPDPPECVQVGAAHTELPSITIGESGVSPADLSMLRDARRVRLAATSVPMAELLAAFTAVAALRSSTGNDRLPLVVVGDEPPDPSPADPGDLPIGFDLSVVRAGTVELRRAQRPRSSAGVAERVEPTERHRVLAAADSTAVTTVLAALGCSTSDGSVWSCSRPSAHNNGDAKPSAKVYGNAARCHRCDDEPLGPVALVSQAMGVTADEAAVWLTALTT